MRTYDTIVIGHLAQIVALKYCSNTYLDLLVVKIVI